MVNWPTVARPTALGGLGVLDLKLFALVMPCKQDGFGFKRQTMIGLGLNCQSKRAL
jgi:hypothetical protein